MAASGASLPPGNTSSSPTVSSEGTLRCSTCKDHKAPEEFAKDPKHIARGGRSYRCKACCRTFANTRHAERMADDEGYAHGRRESYFRKTYGITQEHRAALLSAQGWECAICRASLLGYGQGTHTDHCHTTGNLRGMLCTNCNRGLGHFKDNPELLTAARDYLRKHAHAASDCVN